VTIKTALISTLFLLAAESALAQIPGAPSPNMPQQKAPPVKKFDGICYPPESPFYSRIKQDFIPFVAMIDCVKSGGTAAKR
jgi:hypothetical protein